MKGRKRKGGEEGDTPEETNLKFPYGLHACCVMGFSWDMHINKSTKSMTVTSSWEI